MIRTISIGRYSLVQDTFIRAFPDGKIAVRIGKQMYTGHPVNAA